MKTRTNQPVTTYDLEELEVSGNAKLFENIVDKDGHKRFIEGEIDFNETEGYTKTYGKWSLSGTHLLIVIAGIVANNTPAGNRKIANINLPSWIINKINNLFGIVVATKQLIYYGNDYSTQVSNVYLEKQSDVVQIALANPAITAQRQFRVEFDILIDNE